MSFGFAFATDVIVEQTKFYNQEVTIMYQLLLILSTQILGYTFAGLARRFLVRPGGMIWPGTLMSAAMFTTLHKEESTVANGWRMTRWKFFFVVWLSAFLFYFLPGLLFPALSYFSVITWVCTTERYRCKPFWGGIWPGPFPYYIRLGSNRVYWVAPVNTFLGRHECDWRSCYCHVDHCSGGILLERFQLILHADSIFLGLRQYRKHLRSHQDLDPRLSI